MWLSYHEHLLTMDILDKRSIHTSTLCLFCGVNLETATHILLYCPFTLELWVAERNRLVISFWPSSIVIIWR